MVGAYADWAVNLSFTVPSCFGIIKNPLVINYRKNRFFNNGESFHFIPKSTELSRCIVVVVIIL